MDFSIDEGVVGLDPVEDDALLAALDNVEAARQTPAVAPPAGSPARVPTPDLPVHPFFLQQGQQRPQGQHQQQQQQRAPPARPRVPLQSAHHSKEPAQVGQAPGRVVAPVFGRRQFQIEDDLPRSLGAPEATGDLSVFEYPINMPKRDYQLNISMACARRNTLVCLPTGLGKTFIAAVVMHNFARWFPRHKVLFLAPTKPLVTQQVEACQRISGFSMDEISVVTGASAVNKRADMWTGPRVFFCTPQTVANDLKSGRFPAESISCLVIDEAHKALGAHAYTMVARQVRQATRSFRVVALSATPGARMEQVQEVVRNLFISDLQVRNDDSLDVAPYLHHKTVHTDVVDLSPQLQRLRDQYLGVLRSAMAKLAPTRMIAADRPIENMSGPQLMQMRDSWRSAGALSLGGKERSHLEHAFAVALSLLHGWALLHTHGLGSLRSFVLEPARKAVPGPHTAQLLGIVGQRGPPSLDNHPKLPRLIELLREHFVGVEDPRKTRVMVFSQYRDSVAEIVHLIREAKLPHVHVSDFVGQSAVRGKARQTQREQVRTVEEFRRGTFNVLVATSIGEEGLDIGDVDLIVFFDVQASPIRMIQRMGRTGRKRDGRVVVMTTVGLEERAYHKGQTRRSSIFDNIARSAGQALVFYDDQHNILPPKADAVAAMRPKMMLFEPAPFDWKMLLGGHGGPTRRRSAIEAQRYLKTRWLLPEGEAPPQLDLSAWTTYQGVPTPTLRVRHAARTLEMCSLIAKIGELECDAGDIYGIERRVFMESDLLAELTRLRIFGGEGIEPASGIDAGSRGGGGAQRDAEEPEIVMATPVDPNTVEMPWSDDELDERVRKNRREEDGDDDDDDDLLGDILGTASGRMPAPSQPIKQKRRLLSMDTAVTGGALVRRAGRIDCRVGPAATEVTMGANPAAMEVTTAANPAATGVTTAANPAAMEVTPAANPAAMEVTPAANPAATGVTPAANPAAMEVTPAANPAATSVTTAANPAAMEVTPAANLAEMSRAPHQVDHAPIASVAVKATPPAPISTGAPGQEAMFGSIFADMEPGSPSPLGRKRAVHPLMVGALARECFLPSDSSRVAETPPSPSQQQEPLAIVPETPLEASQPQPEEQAPVAIQDPTGTATHPPSIARPVTSAAPSASASASLTPIGVGKRRRRQLALLSSDDMQHEPSAAPAPASESLTPIAVGKKRNKRSLALSDVDMSELPRSSSDSSARDLCDGGSNNASPSPVAARRRRRPRNKRRLRSLFVDDEAGIDDSQGCPCGGEGEEDDDGDDGEESLGSLRDFLADGSQVSAGGDDDGAMYHRLAMESQEDYGAMNRVIAGALAAVERGADAYQPSQVSSGMADFLSSGQSPSAAPSQVKIEAAPVQPQPQPQQKPQQKPSISKEELDRLMDGVDFEDF